MRSPGPVVISSEELCEFDSGPRTAGCLFVIYFLPEV